MVKWVNSRYDCSDLTYICQSRTNHQLIYASAYTSGGETVFSRLQDRASTHGPGYCSSQPGREANQVVPDEVLINLETHANVTSCLQEAPPGPSFPLFLMPF